MSMKRRYVHKENILLVNITRLGDMLQATPTIAGMKMENPNCKITVLVEKQFEDVCYALPHIDEVISVDLGMTVRCLAREHEGIVDAYEYVEELVEDLRRRKFDYCLNMSSSAYTALLIRLVGIERNGGWTADEEGYRVIESDWAKLFASSVFPHNRQFNSLNLVDVFRCSADVELHSTTLMMNVAEKDQVYIDDLLSSANFKAKGPLVALQAGASQEKRQWAGQNFVRLIELLRTQLDARVVMTGSPKELPIIAPIVQACNSSEVFIAAGKTSIPQLGALLKRSDVLITGDTGPMHMSVSVGTPVISVFLASAYGFETGPYSEGNIVIQPVISCGPCNPNKPCAKTDCHDTVSPELIAALTAMRTKGQIDSLPAQWQSFRGARIYRTTFDAWGFYDLQCLNTQADHYEEFRVAYRKLWLDDIAGFDMREVPVSKRSALGLAPVFGLEGREAIIQRAKQGNLLIAELIRIISDLSAPAARLGEINQQLSELDREIEQLGFHYPALGPVARMFIFAKENLVGSDVTELASQMGRAYQDLERRVVKLFEYFQQASLQTSSSAVNSPMYGS